MQTPTSSQSLRNQQSAPSRRSTTATATYPANSLVDELSSSLLPDGLSQVSLDTAISRDKGDMKSLILMIPFRKLAIWGLVIAFALQLSDFFGVRRML